MPTRSYTYYDFTVSICNHCLRRVDAKILFEDGSVYMRKHCPEHGWQTTRIATDIEYYKRCREYIKPGETPYHFSMPVDYGCPYDCGLCSDHEQHSCLTLIEVTDRCNLSCPTCYALSSPTYGRHRSMEEINAMLDAIVHSEHEPDVVQISGGEPTIHPQFFEIMDAAKARPIRHLMLNTNGVRIAQDPGFAERLAEYMPDFEIYLQFDSFKASALEHLRGKDLLDVRTKALDKLNALNISTTLVVTLERGINEDEIGSIIEYALQQRCVRGVTFQPTQQAGRLDSYNKENERLSLSEVRQMIIDQSDLFTAQDLIPVPCNPDALCMAYALKLDSKVFPLTRLFDPADFLQSAGNTIVFERNEELRQEAFRLFSTGTPIDKAHESLQALLCCLPKIMAPQLRYDNLFRIIIMQFMDVEIFDVRAAKRSCVHIVNKDGHIIPFDTMNIFYRDDKREYLKQLQSERHTVTSTKS